MKRRTPTMIFKNFCVLGVILGLMFFIYFTAADFLAKRKIPREWETALCLLIGAGGWILMMLVYDSLQKKGRL